MKDWHITVLFYIYYFGVLLTFVYLTLFDGYVYNWWNWIIALPVNIFLGLIWPLYWLFLSWTMG